MAWVLDRQVLDKRDGAEASLARVVDQGAYAVSRSQTVLGGSNLALGAGHREGDRIVADITHALNCVQRARNLAATALAEVRLIDVTRDEE